MQRIVEPEIMAGVDQATAYAQADFSKPNQAFIDGLLASYGLLDRQCVLDIGCGPGDIAKTLAARFPNIHITAIDGSKPMLAIAQQVAPLGNVVFEQCCLPDQQLPVAAFDVLISNSLLHHLHNPQVLWQTIKHCAKSTAFVYVMDLFRMPSADEARKIVEQYAHNEPPILQNDFYRSLCAAFTLDEIRQQLVQARLTELTVDQTSDRHVVIQGHLLGNTVDRAT